MPPRPVRAAGRPRPDSPEGEDPFIAWARTATGVRTVRVVRNPGTPQEESFETEAQMQSKVGHFALNTPIYEGDYVELPDPRAPGTMQRRYAATVEVLDNHPEPISQKIRVTWGPAPGASGPEPRPDARPNPAEPLSTEGLHPAVRAAAEALFASGHYDSAISEAFKSLEVRVRSMTDIDAPSATDLMSKAFNPQHGYFDVSTHSGTTGISEREGFLALFRGAVLGIRNPRAHELIGTSTTQEALEHLAFASLLHRKLDTATVRSS